jgi:TolB-like protein/DNA-binding winged helix-turn-helix (wHTH) protein/Tfp pilus assembly protein PilF
VSEHNNSSLTVGDLLVEPSLNRISGARGAVNLRPQVMELLVFLASHAGQVVSVEDLLDKVWPGKVVTDGTLYNCVGELRKAIASLDDTRSYIENIAKKGYRLSVPVGNIREPVVTPAADGGSASGIESGATSGRRTSVVLAIIGGLIFAAAATSYLAGPRDYRSVAVLPFEDISPGGDQAYFAKGISDEVRLELQRLDGLRVAGRTSSIAYAREDSKTIGKTLDVDAIIEGSIRQQGANIRITAQLTHAEDGFTIWSESYNRRLENIFEIQEEIASSVAGALGVRLGVGDVNAFHGAGTRNIEAYETYLQAHSKDYTQSGVLEAIPLLERAVELDPNYAVAWSTLAVRVLSTSYDAATNLTPEIVLRAYELASRGVQLDPESAATQSAWALVRMNQHDWIGSGQGHARAIELLEDRPTLEKYAFMLMRAGRMDDAHEQFLNAVAVEPLDGRPHSQIWHPLLAQGRIAEAKEIVSRHLQEIEKIWDSVNIAFNEQDPEALKAAIRAMPETDASYSHLHGPLLAEFDSPERVLSMLQELYRDKSVQWPRKLDDIALAAAYFGDPQFALKVKSEEVRKSSVRLHKLWYPVMSEVRRLPEFKDLVTELNLVRYWREYGWADSCRPLGHEDFECF